VENMLASLSLRVLHLFYFLAVLLSNIWQSFERRKPKHLAAERTKVPSHLALILVTSEDIDAETTEKSFVECIARAVTWCQAVGIRQFSVYDCEGTYQLS
jgi:dehydrodolichyl diphosphate syntase complex subunit NUS1